MKDLSGKQNGGILRSGLCHDRLTDQFGIRGGTGNHEGGEPEGTGPAVKTRHCRKPALEFLFHTFFGAVGISFSFATIHVHIENPQFLSHAVPLDLFPDLSAAQGR